MIELRLSEKSETDLLIAWLNDPEILYGFPMNNLFEVEDAAKVWISYAKSHRSAFTIFYQDRPVGMCMCYVHTFKKLRHQSLFSIVIDKSVRGKQIGSEALLKLMTIAKEDLGIEMLHLEVYEGNPAYRLYKRLGFTEYGRHPKFLKEKTGTYRDKILMQKWL